METAITPAPSRINNEAQVWRKSCIRGSSGVAGLLHFTQISAGGLHNSAVDTSGAVWSWGWNGLGQLGNGNTADQGVPIRLGLGSIREVSSGFAHTLALDDTGKAFAWGWNVFGQLGDGTTLDRLVPTTVSAPPLTDLSAGLLHTLAVGDSSIYAWGWNGLSQLGDGTTATRPTPYRLPVAGTMSSVAAGGLHSLAVRVN